MSKIAFVTDSTSYIPQDLVKKYNITVAPQVLIWGDKTYQEGVDIQPEEFYSRIKTATVMPTTSQVSVVTMQTIFTDLVEKGFDVLGIFISSKLSGTIQSAVQAKDLMGSAGEKVHVVDSQSTAMALGFQVIAAARAADLVGGGLRAGAEEQQGEGGKVPVVKSRVPDHAGTLSGDRVGLNQVVAGQGAATLGAKACLPQAWRGTATWMTRAETKVRSSAVASAGSSSGWQPSRPACCSPC
jgi:hypothetical protein